MLGSSVTPNPCSLISRSSSAVQLLTVNCKNSFVLKQPYGHDAEFQSFWPLHIIIHPKRRMVPARPHSRCHCLQPSVGVRLVPMPSMQMLIVTEVGMAKECHWRSSTPWDWRSHCLFPISLNIPTILWMLPSTDLSRRAPKVLRSSNLRSVSQRLASTLHPWCLHHHTSTLTYVGWAAERVINCLELRQGKARGRK